MALQQVSQSRGHALLHTQDRHALQAAQTALEFYHFGQREAATSLSVDTLGGVDLKARALRWVNNYKVAPC